MERFSIKQAIYEVSFKLSHSMDAVTKTIQDEYNKLQIVHHMSFAQKPPDDLLIDWHLASCYQEKDINYWHFTYKRLQEYTVPKIKYITLRTIVEKPKEDEEDSY